jgi:elongation factor Ts
VAYVNCFFDNKEETVGNITAANVAALRSKTGAGMMDCKKALTEAGGDMDQAVGILRKKGLSAAAKKSGRVAVEGAVIAAGDDHRGVLLEVNSETDFVAKNESFQAFCQGVAQAILDGGPENLEALKSNSFPGGKTVAEAVTDAISTIGENINIRRFALFENTNGVVSSYIHAGGKIGVLVELDTGGVVNDKIKELGHQLAMHVAAANPSYLRREDVPAAEVDKEKEIMAEKAKASGKPENIIDKIVSGQINKYFGEICLDEQQFVIDPDRKVNKVIADLAKDAGTELKLNRFVRYQLGEGLEKKGDDFAQEVADLTK